MGVLLAFVRESTQRFDVPSGAHPLVCGAEERVCETAVLEFESSTFRRRGLTGSLWPRARCSLATCKLRAVRGTLQLTLSLSTPCISSEDFGHDDNGYYMLRAHSGLFASSHGGVCIPRLSPRGRGLSSSLDLSPLESCVVPGHFPGRFDGVMSRRVDPRCAVSRQNGQSLDLELDLVDDVPQKSTRVIFHFLTHALFSARVTSHTSPFRERQSQKPWT